MLFSILTTVAPPEVEVVGEVGKSVELSWSKQSGVESYQVSYVRTGGVINSCPHFVDSGSIFGTATGVTLDNLEEDSVYNVTVTAMSGTSTFPTTIMITTAEAGNFHTTYRCSYRAVFYGTHHLSPFSSLWSSSRFTSHRQ